MFKPLLITLATAITLDGCAVERIALGAPRDQVLARYGAPTRVVPIASGTRLQYSRQPVGQTAIMVDLDAADQVVQKVGQGMEFRDVREPRD